MNSKTILVTGANGQLGSELRKLSADSPSAFIFTDLAELDITDPVAVEAMCAGQNVGFIINCAAYTQVDLAEDDPETADRINHQAPAILARASKKYGATLIHISTDYVFDGSRNVPYVETDPTRPLGVYGQTKLAGEQAVAASGCDYLIFRTSWLYSQFGKNFVKTMLNLTAQRDSLRVVFDQVGTPTYAGDLARLILHVIESGKTKGNGGVYHFSDEGVCSWYDFAHEIAALTGNTGCRITPCHSWEFPSKVTRPAFSVLDKTRVKETFGYTIPHWRDSLAACLPLISENN